ncbi:MAG: TerC family protein [Flavitalea sp.]
MQFPDFADPSVWISLVTLSFLEIVLGVDNIIFISIVASKLREDQQEKARKLGLILAMFFRIGLLLGITWMIQLTTPLFTINFIKGQDGLPIGISWKDIILFAGGVFLIAKSTLEIHHKLEQSTDSSSTRTYSGFKAVIVQIILVDAVFSFDSILTAIGLVDNVIIMIIAVVISMLVMIGYSGIITRFINKHPTLQMLALTFLIVIGVLLVAESFHQEISKSYIYTAIAFSLTVEMLNMRLRKKQNPVQLNTGPRDEQKSEAVKKIK